MDDLQFQKAEYAGDTPSCTACKSALTDEYFQIAGSNICAPCAAIFRRNGESPSHAAFMKGLLYGAGTAFACFVGYSIFMLTTGFEFALIAIFIGWAIGRSIRIGTQGLGGRRCQIAAVALTYMAITLSGLPVGIREYQKSRTPEQKAAAEKAAVSQTATPGSLAVGVVVLAGVAAVSPILGLTEGFGGLLSLAIIFFGLQRAWAMTARDPRILAGPFQRKEPVALG